MDDGFSMCSQSMSCPSTTTSFSSASSAYEAFTPSTSRRSTPNELAFDLDGAFAANQNVEITPPSTSMAKYFPGSVKQEPEYFASIKQEPEQMGFESLPITPMKKFDGIPSDYDLFQMNMAGQTPLGTITPSRSFGMATISPEAAMGAQSYMMTPSRSLSGGSEVADSSSSWSIPAESPVPFFQQPCELSFDDMHALEMERHSQSPMGHYHMHQQQGPPSPNSYRVQRKMMLHEAQRKTSELQRAQIRASQRKRAAAVAAGNPDPNVDVVRRSMCKCDYPGCTKAFRRNEHLKRHKQTYVNNQHHPQNPQTSRTNNVIVSTAKAPTDSAANSVERTSSTVRTT